VFSTAFARFAGVAFPRVENPWPETIDLGFPFALAAAFGVVATAFSVRAPKARRDRAIGQAATAGFLLGSVLYLLALLVQLGSSL
jgi:hypothetical protein